MATIPHRAETRGDTTSTRWVLHSDPPVSGQVGVEFERAEAVEYIPSFQFAA